MAASIDRSGRNGPLTLTVAAPEQDKSLIRVVLRHYPGLKPSALYKALRKRDVRLNGQRIHKDVIVRAGDQITLYLDEAGSQAVSLQQADQAERPDQPAYAIIYQDAACLVINKRPGLQVQAGNGQTEEGRPLLERLRSDLANPDICLCHRLDRQTGGLLVAGTDAGNCAAIRAQMQAGLVVKRYACLVRGLPEAGLPVTAADQTPMLELSAWLEKDARQSLVYIHDTKQPGDLPVRTRYRILQVWPQAGPDGGPVSLLEIELVTGRTHQIRAHLAHLGHPLLGDGKYGRNAYNRLAGGKMTHQQLWATTLLFDGRCSGPLAGLAGRTIRVKPEFTWQKPDTGIPASG